MLRNVTVLPLLLCVYCYASKCHSFTVIVVRILLPLKCHSVTVIVVRILLCFEMSQFLRYCCAYTAMLQMSQFYRYCCAYTDMLRNVTVLPLLLCVYCYASKCHSFTVIVVRVLLCFEMPLLTFIV